MSDSFRKIAIIMRSYNDIDVIRKTLAILSRQRLQNFELWNFASRSTDGTLEVIREFNEPERILVNDPANYNPGRILNEAVDTVDADILVFLNSDATPCNEYWLEKLIEPLEDSAVGAVFGRQIARNDCRSLFVKDTERAFGDGSESAAWVHFFSMATSAARRSVLKRFPFEQAIQYSEDIEWSYRLRRGGFRIQYAPHSVVTHSHNYTLSQSWRRHFGEGVADAFIFSDSEINRSWWRCFLMPFVMESLRDIRWSMTHKSVDALVHSIPLRFTQKWARWRGMRHGWKNNHKALLSAKPHGTTYTFDGNQKAEERMAMDQSIIGAYVEDAIPANQFEALVLMGGYGRGEGGYCLKDGKPSPYNDYDYFIIVKNMSRKAAQTLQHQLQELAHRLSVIVGVEVDLAVLRSETLANAPFSLMNAEMKWGHRVVAGNQHVIDPMPAMPFDKLALGEFTRLMNNRGALLLMNGRKLDSGENLDAPEREIFFKYLLKAVLACGDVYLAVEAAYHPSYIEKGKRLLDLKKSPGQDFLHLYTLAVEQKFRPDMAVFKDKNLENWQRNVTNHWLKAFSILETHRTRDPIHSWKEYALPRLSKGQLETSQTLRNFAITLRDFGAGHTLRNLNWALRYPRERLISVLPLLLKVESGKTLQNVVTPLAVSPQSTHSQVVERYLETWARYA
jgi:rhamnosyltransferase